MKHPEEAIERVLTGLREAQTPAGMEARILRALDARTARKESRASWREWMVGRHYAARFAGGAALAGVAVVALVITSMHRAVPNARGVREMAALGSLAGSEVVVPQRLKPQDLSGGYGTAEVVPSSKAATYPSEAVRSFSETADSLKNAFGSLNRAGDGGRIQSGAGKPGAREPSAAEVTLDFDALALSEMLAPSRPAPALPPTRQERLLAQVVHHGDPEQIAELKPDLREQEIEMSKAEVHDFFEPPPAKVAE